MLELLVCFSIVNDTADITRNDWRKLAGGHFPIDSTRMIIDSYDEAALEYALRVKEEASASGRGARCTALTIAEGLDESFSRSLFAIGFDRVLLLRTEPLTGFRPDDISNILSLFLTQERFDMIFLGRQNSLSCGGQTAARLSALSGLPCIGHTTDCSFDGSRLRAVCKTKNGQVSAYVAPSGIFSFDDAVHPYLRIATLRDKMSAGGKAAEIIDLPARSFDDEVRLISVSYDPPRRDCVMIEAETAGEKAASLLKLFVQGEP